MNLVAMNRSFAGLALLGGTIALILLIMLVVPSTRQWLAKEVRGHERTLLAGALLTSLIATAGSLYYSETVGFAPCLLCWYQRIAMYPLVPVLAVAMLTSDTKVWRYALPLSLSGLTIAAYHVAIQFRPALEVAACSEQAPCNVRYVSVLGAVSIPFMAGLGFLLISALVLTTHWAEPQEDSSG